MGNIHNTTDMNLPPNENNVQYHKWIGDIYKEIRDVCLKTNEHHINVLKLLDKFLEKFRQYIQQKQGDKSRIHDYHLVRETNRLMFLIRDLFPERNDRDYLMKISEILGGCTFLWLRYHSLEDEQYNETHIEKILNCYAIHLQSTTDESFLLKIITHTLYECKMLPKIFYKILEMHLKRRVQRKGRQNLEVKEDQLYILYIIAFKLWDNLQPAGKNKINIAKYANSYMKPMTSLLYNQRYLPNLPKITLEDVKCGRVTRVVINNLLPFKLLKLAEAVVKEDWLSGSKTPITVDLSMDDDVNRSEEAVQSDPTFVSVNTEIKDLTLDEKQITLSKELWWLKVLKKRALKNMNTCGKQTYRVVEVIDLDDEDVNNCDSTSKKKVEMEFQQNQSKATPSKKVDYTKKIGQKEASSEENAITATCSFSKRQKQQNDTIQEKEHSSTRKMSKKNALEEFEVRDSAESNPYDRITCNKKEIVVTTSASHVDIFEIESQNIQELSNKFKSNEEKFDPNKLQEIEKSEIVSKSKIIIQGIEVASVEPMQIDYIAEETGVISGSKELKLDMQTIKEPTIEYKHEYNVENLIKKKTNQVTKRSILTKTDGNIQNENLSTSNVKRKAVSFTTVRKGKPPLIINRRPTLDCFTIQNEPQNCKSSINNSLLSNQHNRPSQEQDQKLELLPTSDVNSLGSSSPPPMKETGMTQNMFQFENDTQLSVFNDDAVGSNTEVLPNKSCESDNNLVSATDLSASSSTLKVKTDLMSSDSELNNAEEDSVNIIWQLTTEHCDSKPDEKKLQNSLPLKKRRKLSRNGNSFVEVNCNESIDKNSFECYDNQIAYPAERCMSILKILDSQYQTTFFVNNNSSIAIINSSPSQQTILTGGNGFNVIAQQQNGSPSTTNTNVYPNIPIQRDMNEEIPAAENINGNVFQCNQSSSEQNNFEYIINSGGEAQSELNNFDYTLNSNYPTQTTQRNINYTQPADVTLDLSNLNCNVDSNRVEVNSSNNTNFMQENQQRNNSYLQSSNEVNKVVWRQKNDVPDSNQQKNIIQNPQLGCDVQKYNYPHNIDIAAQNQRKNNMQCASAEMNDYSNFTLNPNIPVSNIHITQNMQQQQRVNNCSLNANIESQRAIAQNMQNSDQKFNYSLNINRPIQNTQSNVDYKLQSCDLRSIESSPQNLSQLSMETGKCTGNMHNKPDQSAQMNKYNENSRNTHENIDHVIPSNMNQMQNNTKDQIENQKNETADSQLNSQGRDIPEKKGVRESVSVEDAAKLAKQQLFGVNMDHYNLKYEHMSNYFHNNQINFAKKRALLHDEEQHFMFWNKGDHGSEKYLPDNSKKQPKLKKKCEESRGKSRKSKKLITARITRSSNRTLPVNYEYKDDGLTESRKRKSSSVQ